jgi:hypothetical protein
MSADWLEFLSVNTRGLWELGSFTDVLMKTGGSRICGSITDVRGREVIGSPSGFRSWTNGCHLRTRFCLHVAYEPCRLLPSQK